MCHNNSIHRQNIWCFFEIIKIMLILSLLRKYDDASNTTNLVSVCPADSVTKRYSIWIDTIKKYTSNGMYRVTV
jgi:hypothetical protein